MGTVRSTPAYMGLMAFDVSVGEPFYASGVPGHFSPSYGAPFWVSGWSGKSDYTPMSPSASPPLQDASGPTTSFVVSVTPNGGVGPYTYQWYIASQGGSDPGPNDGSFYGSTTTDTVTVQITLTQPFKDWTVTVYCAVTDSHGNTVNSSMASCQGHAP